MSTLKWSQPSTEFVVWILKTLLGQSFILLLPHPLFSSITGVTEVVVKLILRSDPLHVLTLRGKVLRFTLFNKSRRVFFCHIFVLTKGVVLVPPNLNKLTLVAPPSMRDGLHSFLLPLLLQLFRILDVCLNRVFEGIVLFIFLSSHQIPTGLMTPFDGNPDHKPWIISYSLSCPRVHLCC
jgi:hypothetical protein